MKKNYHRILLIVIAIFSLSLMNKNPNIDLIEFYDKTQEKTLEELISLTYKNSKVPIIYFYADWCKPCVAFKKNLDNKLVQEALKNATLIKVNIDIDEQNIVTDYSVRAVPTYIKVDKKGGIIAKIDSGKWGKDKPKNTAPVLEKLINSDSFDN